ncbi:hypothetical protein KGMB01110_28060 [Mediterraneibacter butyricigenes]|uniref:G domain-containing protein n=1 Tax=Mediterraneibacter butyricigenes TaxID=2316025 RepID=A0A391P4Y4_9FIRM|nr:hypothetical protein KGMB01110_28060 [Mediterraneibacter butyricigenes]
MAQYFQEKGYHVVKVNSKKGTRDQIHSGCDRRSLQREDRKRPETGNFNRPVRAMVVGIPNVGKSTLLIPLQEKPAQKPGISRV